MLWASLSVPVVVRQWHPREVLLTWNACTASVTFWRDTARVSEWTVYLGFTDLMIFFKLFIVISAIFFYMYMRPYSVRKVIVNVLCFWWGCYWNQISKSRSDHLAISEWTVPQDVCNQYSLGHFRVWICSKCAVLTVTKQWLVGRSLSIWRSSNRYNPLWKDSQHYQGRVFSFSYWSGSIIDLLGLCWLLRRKRKRICPFIPTHFFLSGR